MSRITLEVDEWTSTGALDQRKYHCAVYAPDTGRVVAYGSDYRSSAAARKVCRADALRCLFEHEDAASNARRCAIGTSEGPVILVEYRHGHWGYVFLRADTDLLGGCVTGDTFEECRQRAREHAECFGGITWESK